MVDGLLLSAIRLCRASQCVARVQEAPSKSDAVILVLDETWLALSRG